MIQCWFYENLLYNNDFHELYLWKNIFFKGADCLQIFKNKNNFTYFGEQNPFSSSRFHQGVNIHFYAPKFDF